MHESDTPYRLRALRLAKAAVVVTAIAVPLLATAGPASASPLPASTTSTAMTSHLQRSATDVTCSGYDCDDTDPYVTHCADTAFFVGWFTGENHALKVFYSNACGTNFAYADSKLLDGYPLRTVTVTRYDPADSTNTGTEMSCAVGMWCARAAGYPPTFNNHYLDSNPIPTGATTWVTNQLYAPVAQVNVCVTTFAPGTPEYCGYRH